MKSDLFPAPLLKQSSNSESKLIQSLHKYPQQRVAAVPGSVTDTFPRVRGSAPAWLTDAPLRGPRLYEPELRALPANHSAPWSPGGQSESEPGAQSPAPCGARDAVERWCQKVEGEQREKTADWKSLNTFYRRCVELLIINYVSVYDSDTTEWNMCVYICIYIHLMRE